MIMKSNATGAERTFEIIGGIVLRYGLVVILLYFGAFKFTTIEAQGVQPLVANSPFMSWMYGVMSVQTVSNLLGVTEIIIGVLIAARPFFPGASAIGSFGAVVMFLITLTFLFSTPGMWQQVSSFPLPVPSESGGFLVKDWFLLGAALWTAGEALRAARLQ